MAETTFSITYDGVDLTSGRMDVKDLAPALLALGEIIQESHRVLHPQEPPVNVHVTALEQGSFACHLVVSNASLLGQVIDMFSGDNASALANLIEIVGGVGGAFALVRWLLRRSIRRQRLNDDGTITVEFSDNTTITVPGAALRLSQNFTIRRRLREVVRPLEREGIDELRYAHESIEEVRVTKEDVPAFDVPDMPETLLTETTQDVIVRVAAASFIEGNKWRLTLGDTTFFAAIEDSGFVDRVNSGEPFSKHDLLRVRLRLTQHQVGDDLRTEYAVEQVLDHVMREPPVPLPFEDPFEPDEGYPQDRDDDGPEGPPLVPGM